MKVRFLLLCMSLTPMLFADLATQKKALVLGVAGQDGIYLTDLLLEKNYEVHGIKRKNSQKNLDCLDLLQEKAFRLTKSFFVYEADLRDPNTVSSLIQSIMPDEIYNLAAESHVGLSFKNPISTGETNAIGPLRILEVIRELKSTKQIKYYQASTSEMFGKVQEVPEVETTPFYPRSPYAVSKLFAHWMTVIYREAFGIFACNGILCNHESPLREESFVTRKIILAACRYKYGLQDILYLGNLNAKRDWGYARDYVEAMWLILQHEKPDDYVIATGEIHSVREFTELTYKQLGIEVEWHGNGIHEYGTDKSTGKVIVKVNPEFYRPLEVEFILGSGRKAKEILKWEPKTQFVDLLKVMIEADVAKIEKEIKGLTSFPVCLEQRLFGNEKI